MNNPVLESDILLLPGEPAFEQTMILGWKVLYGQTSQGVMFGVDGLPRSIESEYQLQDYLESGEYDKRLELIGHNLDDEDEVVIYDPEWEDG